MADGLIREVLGVVAKPGRLAPANYMILSGNVFFLILRDW